MILEQHKMIKESKEEYKNMSSENEISLCRCSIKEIGFCDTIMSFSRKTIIKIPKDLRIMRDSSTIQKTDSIP